MLQVTGALDWIIEVAAPLTIGWLGLPAEAATAFVMGFVRRDFGATGFFTMNLTDAQLLVGMVTITLFVPCIASAMVIWKERGWVYFVGLFAGSIGSPFFVGGADLATPERDRGGVDGGPAEVPVMRVGLGRDALPPLQRAEGRRLLGLVRAVQVAEHVQVTRSRSVSGRVTTRARTTSIRARRWSASTAAETATSDGERWSARR